MPCYDRRDHEPDYRVDLYAAWLCSILRRMSPEQIKGLLPEIQKWWIDHQRFDTDREGQ